MGTTPSESAHGQNNIEQGRAAVPDKDGTAVSTREFSRLEFLAEASRHIPDHWEQPRSQPAL